MTRESGQAPAAAGGLAEPEGDDWLLECLLVLGRRYARPQSRDSIRAGLPLEGNRLTPALFGRAARRLGLSATPRRWPLKRLDPLTLPAVLLLEDGRAWLATAMDRDAATLTLIQPESGGEVALPVTEVAPLYSGEMIFVRPEPRTEQAGPGGASHGEEHWFWPAFRSSWRMYRDVIVASILLNLFALATPFFILNVYDRVVPNQAIETLWVLALGVGIVYGFEMIMRGLRGYFIDMAGRRTDIEVSNLIFERVLNLRAEARPDSVGSLANDLHAFERVREFITSTTIVTLVDMPFAILFLAVIYLIGGYVALPPLAGVPVIILFGLAVQPPLRRAVERSFSSASRKNAVMVEGLAGIETVKTLGAEGEMQRRWEEGVQDNSRWNIRSRMFSNSVTNVSHFVRRLALIGVIVLGVYAISDGTLTTGGLIACVILTRYALAPIGHVAGLAARYHHAKTAFQELDRIMSLPVERPAEKSFAHRERFAGAIRFEDVDFTYPGRSKPAISDISFGIDAGEHVGIIGPTGSGKTTLAKLVLSLYQPSEGHVTIDGIDSRQLEPSELRHAIGYVPQDVVLFRGTVRENITLGAGNVSDERVVDVAEMAGVLEFVNRDPRGFDMPVGERGVGLSGGQRQSIAIARALLLDPPILLLDEPSNSIDNRSEARLKRRLARVTPGKTVIVITHHRSMLDLVDRVLIVDGGRLVADGPKRQVLQGLQRDAGQGARQPRGIG